MLIKLAGMKDVGKWLEAKLPNAASHIPNGIALTGGIAAADSITRATFAKPGERKKAALEGLVQGTLYGAALSAVEPMIGDPLKKAFGFKLH